MTSSRFPFWRTNPAGFGVSGYWPILTGCLAVLIIPPLLGIVGEMIAVSIYDTHRALYLRIAEVTFFLIGSPLFSWAPLLVAVPLSGFAAARGFAGWGVALLCGTLCGLVTGGVLVGGLDFGPETRMVAALGSFFALIYWGAIRVMHPTTIGIPFKNAARAASKGGSPQ